MKHTILVVDDEPHIVRLYDMLLSGEGFEVLTAQSGEEALTIINSQVTIHLMVIDKRMPKVDGLTVVKELAAQRRIFPVIIITGSLGRHFTDEDLCGAPSEHIAYLTKPCEFDQLLATIQKMLAHYPFSDGGAG